MARIKIEFGAWLLLMASFLVFGGMGAWHRESLAAYLKAQDRHVLLQEARALSGRGDEAGAQAAFAHLLDQYPKHEEVLLAYAQHLDRSEQTAEAEYWYAHAAGLGQQRFSAVRRYAGFLDRQGRAEDSLSLYRDYTGRFPGDTSAQLDFGLRLLDRGDARDAIPHLEAAATNEALLGEAEGARGMACAVLGDRDAALAAWTQAAQSGTGPQSAIFWQDVAIACSERGEWNEARLAWEQFLAVFPDSIPGLEGMAAMTGNVSAHEQAGRALRRLRAIAAAYAPRNGEGWQSLISLDPRHASPAPLTPWIDVETAVLYGSPKPGVEVWADVLFSMRRNIRDASDLRVRFWVLSDDGAPIEIDVEPSTMGAAPQWRGNSVARHFSLRLPASLPAAGWRIAISGKNEVQRAEVAAWAGAEDRP